MSTICPSCGAKNLEGADECANCGGDLQKLVTGDETWEVV